MRVFCIWHKKKAGLNELLYVKKFFFPTIQFQQVSVENSYKALGFIII